MSLMATLPVTLDRGIMTPWDNSTFSTTTTMMARVMTASSSPYEVTTNTSRDYVISEEDKESIIAISIIMACTLVGNLTLILILLCKRSRRIKRVNIFLINLAFGDLAVALFVNSTEILFLAFGDWVLGAVMCKVMVYVQMVCLASATNLLTAMTLDRYQVIVKPMETLARRPRILLKITIAWVLSLIFPLPQLFIFVQYETGDVTPKRICGSRGYTAPWQRKVYFTFTTTYILIVPMLIMLYCYARIIHVVWVRASKDVLQHSAATQQQVHHHPLHNHHHPHHHHKNQYQQEQQNKPQQQLHNHPNKQQTKQQHPRPRVLRNPSVSDALPSDCSPNQTPDETTTTALNLKTNTIHGSNEDPASKRKDFGGGETKHPSSNEVSETNNKNGSRTNSTSSVKWAETIGDTATTNKESIKNPSSLTVAGRKSRNASRSSQPSVQVSVRRKMMTSSKRRVLTMTLSVVMSFFICHTPYFVLTLIRIYSNYNIKMETAKVIGEFMVMVHSTLNPLLYGLFTLRQKHLKHLASLVGCFGFRRQRRTSADDLDNKGEMYCLLRRRPVSKATGAVNNKSGNDKNSGNTGNGCNSNCVISGYKTSSSTNDNRASGSPTSLSTSASSSTASLKSSILSRFRRKNNNKCLKPVLSSCSGRNSVRERDNSIGESLLYSNIDALDMCTMSTSGEEQESSYSSCKLSPKSTTSTTNNDTLSNSELPSSKLSERNRNCKQCDNNMSFSPAISSSSHLPPLPPPPYSPPHSEDASSNSEKNKINRNVHASLTDVKDYDDKINTNNNPHTHHDHRHHPRRRRRHHNRNLAKDKKQNNENNPSAESSIVLSNPLVSSMEDQDDELKDGVIRNDIEENLETTAENIEEISRSTLNFDKYEHNQIETNDVPEKEEKNNSPVTNNEDVMEDMKIEEEEEEEEIIPPVDFNSTPWEDEFIIGGLSRV